MAQCRSTMTYGIDPARGDVQLRCELEAKHAQLHQAHLDDGVSTSWSSRPTPVENHKSDAVVGTAGDDDA